MILRRETKIKVSSRGTRVSYAMNKIQNAKRVQSHFKIKHLKQLTIKYLYRKSIKFLKINNEPCNK